MGAGCVPGRIVAAWLLILLACLAPFAQASGQPAATGQMALEARWQAGSDAPWQSFDPARLGRIPRVPEGTRVQLRPLQGGWPQQGQWLVSVRAPGLGPYRWQAEAGGWHNTSLLQLPRQGVVGHNRVGIPLPPKLDAGEPFEIWLDAAPYMNGVITLELLSRAAFERDNTRFLAISTAVLAVLLTMVVLACIFALRFADITFVYYGGYLLAYGLVMGIQTGYVASVLGWDWIAQSVAVWGRIATGGAVLLAVLFLREFTSLYRFAPRWDVAMRLFCWAMVVVSVLGLVPAEASRALTRALINPLLMIGGPLTLAAGWAAWRGGSRYGGYFVIGWTPLLLVTALTSAQYMGSFASWLWADQALLVAAAFEAFVLTAGLADRVHVRRREHEAMRAEAGADPLTETLNRRTLQQRLDRHVEQAHRSGDSLALFFIDLDGFKRLNDSRGHALGDQALRRVALELRTVLRGDDTLGRYGGDEFLMLLPQVNADRAMQRARQACIRIAAAGRPPSFGEYPLTASIGVALLQPEEGADRLVSRADGAMYAAKHRGGNRACLAPATPDEGGVRVGAASA